MNVCSGSIETSMQANTYCITCLPKACPISDVPSITEVKAAVVVVVDAV
jgi:hypothetical protein